MSIYSGFVAVAQCLCQNKDSATQERQRDVVMGLRDDRLHSTVKQILYTDMVYLFGIVCATPK